MKVSTIGIIGYGSFGKLIERVATKYHPEVEIKVSSRSNDIDHKRFWGMRDVCESDLVFVCTPIPFYESTIKKVAPLVGDQTIIIDVATVKEHTVEILRNVDVPIRYVSSHPMFGPYSYEKLGERLDFLRVVLCEHNLEISEYKLIKSFLRSANLEIIEMTATEHDKKLAETLFLTHFVSQAVIRAGYHRTDIDTVSFGFLMDAVESVKQDTELFQAVYAYNKYCKRVMEDIKKATDRLTVLLEKGV